MFEFAWPWLFLLLPLPWLLRRFTPPARQHSAQLKVPFYAELETLQHQQSGVLARLHSHSFIYSLLWLLLLTAGARPQLHGSLPEQASSGRDLLIAVDVSSSMLYSDMHLDGRSVTRMELVKHWLDNFIAERHGDRLGLILFGSQAYLQAPLTYDHHSVRTWVQEAQPGIAGHTTAIGDAIGLAIKRLRQRPAQQRVLVLITDGANNSGVMAPTAAAQLAARYQIKVYTLGVGSAASQELANLIDASSLELDEHSLQDIAQITSGAYFHIADSTDLTHIHQALNQLEPSATYQKPLRQYQELYSWPLAAALVLSMLWIALRIYRTRTATKELN